MICFLLDICVLQLPVASTSSTSEGKGEAGNLAAGAHSLAFNALLRTAHS